MTPKEKAYELVDTFATFTYGLPKAQAAAMVCVDEIIKAGPRYAPVTCSNMFKEYEEYREIINPINYWGQVKKELQNM